MVLVLAFLVYDRACSKRSWLDSSLYCVPILLLCVGIWVSAILSMVLGGFGALVLPDAIHGGLDGGCGSGMGRIVRSQRVLSTVV